MIELGCNDTDLYSRAYIFMVRTNSEESTIHTDRTQRNKFCFTGGYIETSVQLPGASNVVGLWPAVWTMGNLGRAGYGATLEGMVRRFALLHLVSTLRPNDSGRTVTTPAT